MSDIAAKVVAQSPDAFIQKAMTVYGRKTIEDRAIPDLRDGLKPVQRRILWAMKNLGHPEQYRKAARIVGDTMGNYHPHGDLAIYGALVTMANFSTPFVDGQGNWGNPATGDNAASMRYCFAPGTLVQTEFGLMPIETMGKYSDSPKNSKKRSIDIQVETEDGLSPAAYWIDSGVRNIYRLQTEFGCVDATSNEPFRVFDFSKGEFVWKELKNIKPGDALLTRKGSNALLSKPPSNRDLYIARWLGMVVGDGYISDYEIEFSTSQLDEFEEYKELVNTIFNFPPVRERVLTPEENTLNAKGNQYYLTIKGQKYVALAKRYGLLPGNSYDRVVPEFVLMNEKLYPEFISALWQCDGHIGKQAMLSSRSYKLLMQTQVILRRLGVMSYISGPVELFKVDYDYSKYGREKKKLPELRLVIAKAVPYSAEKFAGLIKGNKRNNLSTFLGERSPVHLFGAKKSGGIYSKMADFVLANAPAYTDKSNSTISSETSYDEFMTGVEEDQVFLSSAMSPWSLVKNQRSKINHRIGMYEFFTMFQHYFQDLFFDRHELYSKLMACDDWMIEEVKSIDLVGKANTYDLTVPGPHHYIANGFVAHNTECRLTAFSLTYLLDPEYLEVTELVPNYDNTTKEPVVLPALVPAIFFSAAQGIAVGVSTTFPPFTEKFIKGATKKFLSGVKPTAKWLAKNVEFDFRGGGNCITPAEELEKLFTHGNCSVEYEVEYSIDVKKRTLTITSNAAGMNIEAKIKQVQDLQHIRSVFNETTDEIRYVIEFKPTVTEGEVTSNAEHLVKKYFTKRIKFSTSVTERVLTEDGDETTADFAELSVIEIFQRWSEWRIDLEVRMLEHRLAKLETKVRNERVLLRAAKQIIALAKLIATKDEHKTLPVRVAKLLKITVDEADMVLSRSLRSLSAMEQSSIRKSIQKLSQEITDTQEQLKNPAATCVTKLSALG